MDSIDPTLIALICIMLATVVLYLSGDLVAFINSNMRWFEHLGWVLGVSKDPPSDLGKLDPPIGLTLLFVILAQMFFEFWPHGILAGVLLWIVLPPIVGMKWQKRREKIDELLPAAVTTMANNLHANLTLAQSISRLAETTPEPIRTEFRLMTHKHFHGASLEQAIEEARDRVDRPNFRLFATALLMNRELGGDLSLTLDRLAHSLVKLDEMQKTLGAATSQGKFTIQFIVGFIVFVIGLHLLTNTAAFMLMFTTLGGLISLILASGLILLGLFWARLIFKQEL